MKGKRRAEKRPDGTRTTADGREIRSLHHIDDEDELPPRTTEPVGRYDREDDEESEAPAAPTAPEKPAAGTQAVSRAPMKKDRKNEKK